MAEFNIPVYVISLARAKERRANMRRQLDALGMRYEIVDAVDGATLKPEEYMNRLRPRQFKMTYGREVIKGEIGCFLSHCAVLERIAESENDCALILEDDAVLSDDLPNIVKRVNKCEWHWDAVLLSAARRRSVDCVLCDLENDWRLVRYKRKPSSAAAYMIRPAGAKKLLAHCGEIRAGIDHMYAEYWRHGAAFYHVDPPPIKQSGETMIGIAEEGSLGWRVVASFIRKRERIAAALYRRANRPQKRQPPTSAV